jgi:hypothetical protein
MVCSSLDHLTVNGNLFLGSAVSRWTCCFLRKLSPLLTYYNLCILQCMSLSMFCPVVSSCLTMSPCPIEGFGDQSFCWWFWSKCLLILWEGLFGYMMIDLQWPLICLAASRGWWGGHELVNGYSFFLLDHSKLDSAVLVSDHCTIH